MKGDGKIEVEMGVWKERNEVIKESDFMLWMLPRMEWKGQK